MLTIEIPKREFTLCVHPSKLTVTDTDYRKLFVMQATRFYEQ